MKAFQLTEQKEFMNLLLRSETFDNFLLSEASIHAAVRYEIDGHLTPGFYSSAELEENRLAGLSCMPYAKLRPVFYELIKGPRTVLPQIRADALPVQPAKYHPGIRHRHPAGRHPCRLFEHPVPERAAAADSRGFIPDFYA